MNLNYFSGQLKEFFFKIKSSQRHIGEFGELDGGGGYSWKKNYKGANQTENIVGVKTDLTYITGVKNTINLINKYYVAGHMLLRFFSKQKVYF